jgi:hypothetical protein
MQDSTNPRQSADSHPPDANPQLEGPNSEPESRLIRFWVRLKRLGLGNTALRIATGVTTILLVLLVVWVMDTFYIEEQQPDSMMDVANAETMPTPTATVPSPTFNAGGGSLEGLSRDIDLHTLLPDRQSRYDVIQYIIESGDNIFSIAEKFNLKPETILWGNIYTIGDDPHTILPGQILNILPLDGVYHQWSAGEGLNAVSAYYGVTPEDIIEWPGNGLNREEIGDYANPNIPDGTMLVIPGGTGTYTDWRTPRITRDEPATAKNLGSGACTGSYDGIVGTLTFIWPTTERYLSGYDYSPETNHFGIDIAGNLGNPIYAADNGVVVYAGWSEYGYGEMIVIDHGYGWQTLYAHLSQVNVVCGQDVYQGDVIGSMGSTGNSSGPHLHFEMRSDDYGRVNPWDFLQ